MDRVVAADVEELAAVDGVGPVVAQTVHDFFAVDWHVGIVEKWRRAGAPLADDGEEEGPRPLEGVSVVVTGTLPSYSRDGATEAVQERGGKVTGSVSKKTDFVVVGADPGASKYEKAVKLGLPLLDDAGFGVLLEQGPDAARARGHDGGARPGLTGWCRRPPPCGRVPQAPLLRTEQRRDSVRTCGEGPSRPDVSGDGAAGRCAPFPRSTWP